MELSKSTDAASKAGPFSALITMFYDPSRAFAMLQPKRHAWLPLILLIASTVALMTWYFSIVDFPWFMDQLFSAMDAAQREQAKGMMTKTMIQLPMILSAVVMFPAVCAIVGVYFMIVGKSMNKDIGFGTGFALTAWASVPALLALPMGAVAIAMSSGGQLSFTELNPLSVNQLFFGYDMMHPMAGVLDSLNFTTIWSIFLMVIGFQVWAKAERSTAVKVVLIPYLVIYALWFAYALSQAA